MVRISIHWTAIALLVLFAGMATMSLATARPEARLVPAPCHAPSSVPSSPGSQDTGHACCGVGHNQVLLSGKLVLPPLQTAGPKTVSGELTVAAFEAVDAAMADSSPPLQGSFPIRI